MSKELSDRIKELRKRKGYTQKQLAELLGMGQTTVANYEQGIRFPDTDKLKRIADLFGVSIDYLLGRDEKKHNLAKEVKMEHLNSNQAAEVYLEHLLVGNFTKARELILDLHGQGAGMEWIYFRVLETAMKEVGTLWERGSLDIWKEHYISEATLDIMREIKALEKEKPNSRVSIIALNAGSELHSIGLRMISDVLELDGCRMIYLGSNVPVQSLIKAIQTEKPDFIAISLTLESHIDSAVNMIAAIRNHFGAKSPEIVIGGAAFQKLGMACEATQADHCCSTMDDIRNAIHNGRR